MIPRGIPNDIRQLCTQATPVGSRVTCWPAPTDTDEDWLLLVSPDNADELTTLVSETFGHDGSDMTDVELNTPEDHRFNSYSDGQVNLIITTSEVFHRRFLAATSVARRLNLLRKEDRIALFQAVLYGNRCDQPSQDDPFA